MNTYKALFVEADINDGDYISEETKIDENDMPIIRKVCNLLKFHKHTGHYNWPVGEQGSPRDAWSDEIISDSEIAIFNKYVPYDEYGFHTIITIQIREVSDPIILENLL